MFDDREPSGDNNGEPAAGPAASSNDVRWRDAGGIWRDALSAANDERVPPAARNDNQGNYLLTNDFRVEGQSESGAQVDLLFKFGIFLACLYMKDKRYLKKCFCSSIDVKLYFNNAT